MASDKENSTQHSLDRLLREDLAQFNVPVELLNNLREKILALMGRPERKPFGAAVMTAAASMASDQARKDKKVQEGGPTPEII